MHLTTPKLEVKNEKEVVMNIDPKSSLNGQFRRDKLRILHLIYVHLSNSIAPNFDSMTTS